MFAIRPAEALLVILLVAMTCALAVLVLKLVGRSTGSSTRPGGTVEHPAPRTGSLNRAADRWVARWVSFGGAVTVLGLGNLAAALNWNAITKGFGSDPGSIAASAAASAAAASDRYALWGFALLIVGQQMVTRRSGMIDQRQIAAGR